MKKYLFLLAFSINYLISMSFTQKLDQECERARVTNAQKRHIAIQCATQAWLQESQIPKPDRDIIQARYGQNVSVKKVPSMGNHIFSAYFVNYIDEYKRHRQDFINCIETDNGSRQLAVISINFVK